MDELGTVRLGRPQLEALWCSPVDGLFVEDQLFKTLGFFFVPCLVEHILSRIEQELEGGESLLSVDDIQLGNRRAARLE